MKKILIIVALMAGFAEAQTVNPGQIRPGLTNQCLVTVANVATWTTCPGGSGGGAAGPSMALQFNNSAVLGGQASLLTDGNGSVYTTGRISVTGTGNLFLGQDWGTAPFESHNGTISVAASGQVSSTFYNQTVNNTAPSSDMGSFNGSTNFLVNNIVHNDWGAGLFDPYGLFMNKSGTGDFNGGWDSYSQGKGGWTAASDEGVVPGGRVFWNATANSANSGNPMMVGTYTSSTTNSYGNLVMTVNCSAMCQWAGVGHPLVDASTAVTATVTGQTTSTSAAGTVTVLTISGGSFTPDVTGTLATAVNVPNFTPLNAPVIESFALTGLASGLSVGEYFTLAAYQVDRLKVVAITSAFSGGAQTVTAYTSHSFPVGSLLFANTSASSFNGGSLELTNYTSQSGNVPVMFDVLGCSSATSCTVALQQISSIVGLPVTATAVKFYHSAKIVDSGNSCTFSGYGTGRSGDTCAYGGSATGTLTFTVQTSPAVFTAGDTVKNPSAASNLVEGRKVWLHDSNPYSFLIAGDEINIDYGTYTGPITHLNDGATPTVTGQTLVSQGGLVVAPAVSVNTNRFSAGDFFDNYPDGGFTRFGQTHEACILCFGAFATFPSGSSVSTVSLLYDWNSNTRIKWAPAAKTLDFSSYTSETFSSLLSNTLAVTNGATALSFSSNSTSNYNTIMDQNGIHQQTAHSGLIGTATDPWGLAYIDQIQMNALAPGLVKYVGTGYGTGNGFTNAVVGTDYQVPITLTTTGSSGAATFNPTTGALNIPVYSGGSSGFPITLGSTSIASGSTTTTLAGLTLTSPVINSFSGVSGTNNISQGTGGMIQANNQTASSGANYSSPWYELDASFWNGSASIADAWRTYVVEGTGTNPTTTLTIQHSSGSTGTASVSVPNLIVTGTCTGCGSGSFSPITLGTTTLSSGGSYPQVTAVLPSGSVTAGGYSIGTLPYSDTGVLSSEVGSLNGYLQHMVVNTNSGATASADMIVGNNLNTATTYYGDLGMNSSGFTGTGVLNQANAVYLTATSGDLDLYTTTSNAVHIGVNSGATDSMTFPATGGVQEPGLSAGGVIYAAASTGTHSVATATQIQTAMGQATTSTNGYLSSTDWNTFNGKQTTITLTTTGSSGAATFNSSTGALNIPNYAGGSSGINTGTAYSVPYYATTSTISGVSGTGVPVFTTSAAPTFTPVGGTGAALLTGPTSATVNGLAYAVNTNGTIAFASGLTTASVAQQTASNNFTVYQTFQKTMNLTIGTAIASATTIAPTTGIVHVTGTTAIATITTPSGMSSTIGGCIVLIADGAWSTTTSGNIFAAMTATAGTPYNACYDGSHWYIK